MLLFTVTKYVVRFKTLFLYLFLEINKSIRNHICKGYCWTRKLFIGFFLVEMQILVLAVEECVIDIRFHKTYKIFLRHRAITNPLVGRPIRTEVWLFHTYLYSLYTKPNISLLTDIINGPSGSAEQQEGAGGVVGGEMRDVLRLPVLRAGVPDAGLAAAARAAQRHQLRTHEQQVLHSHAQVERTWG